VEGLEPEAGHPQPLQVVEPAAQAGEIADAVAVPVHEGLDVEAVDDRVLVPEVVDHRALFGIQRKLDPGGR
jgi:hypothetical protein